jgi:hypothetical protein
MQGPYIGTPIQRRQPIKEKGGNKSVSRTRKEICQKVTSACRNQALKVERATAIRSFRPVFANLERFLFRSATAVRIFLLTPLTPHIRNVRNEVTGSKVSPPCSLDCRRTCDPAHRAAGVPP